MIPAVLLSVILSIGLSLVIISLDGNWLLKAGFITLSLYLSLSLFLSVENFKGWATNQSLPDDFQIEAILINEPDKSSKEPGGIYLWVSDVDIKPNCYPALMCLTDQKAGGPRAYRIPYSAEEHKRALPLIERLKNGEQILGQIIGDNFFLEDIVIHDLDGFSQDLRKDN